MKVEMYFSVTAEVLTDDFDEAEALAKIKADAIMILARDATGYKFKYVPSALSFSPEINEQINKLNTLLQ